MTTVDTILPHAVRLGQFPGNANALSNLVVRLQLVEDTDALRAFARRFTAYPEVAVTVWRRIVKLHPDNPVILTEAASVYYANGLDQEALAHLDTALALNEKFIPAWELKAALSPNARDRRRIFEHILKIEPGNRNAVDTLIILGRPTG